MLLISSHILRWSSTFARNVGGSYPRFQAKCYFYNFLYFVRNCLRRSLFFFVEVVLEDGLGKFSTRKFRNFKVSVRAYFVLWNLRYGNPQLLSLDFFNVIYLRKSGLFKILNTAQLCQKTRQRQTLFTNLRGQSQIRTLVSYRDVHPEVYPWINCQNTGGYGYRIYYPCGDLAQKLPWFSCQLSILQIFPLPPYKFYI